MANKDYNEGYLAGIAKYAWVGKNGVRYVGHPDSPTTLAQAHCEAKSSHLQTDAHNVAWAHSDAGTKWHAILPGGNVTYSYCGRVIHNRTRWGYPPEQDRCSLCRRMVVAERRSK